MQLLYAAGRCPMTRLLLVLVTAVVALAACTPEQQEQFRALPPGAQAAVVDALRWDGEDAVRSHPFLVCVRRHESDTAGGYAAQNPRSTASGAYQFLDSTWRSVSVRAGFPGWSRAVYAPPWVQDAVALWTYRVEGASHWAGTGCR